RSIIANVHQPIGKPALPYRLRRVDRSYISVDISLHQDNDEDSACPQAGTHVKSMGACPQTGILYLLLMLTADKEGIM
ncbi:hypothetical protein NPIL_320061, partial [Nephila pilipes]